MAIFHSKSFDIDAERYDAPTADSEGNLDALTEYAGFPLVKQTPWNPADGQTCVMLAEPGDSPDPKNLIRPGDYLVKHDGEVRMIRAEAFEATYETAGADPVSTT